MGFMRKALAVSTLGMSRAAGLKLNSAEERTAKATEKQLKLQQRLAKSQRRSRS